MPRRTLITYFSKISSIGTARRRLGEAAFLLSGLIAAATPAASQQKLPARNFPTRNVVWEAKLHRQVAFLADSLCRGRACGTRGGAEAAFWVERRFREAGLAAMCGDSADCYVQAFRTENGCIGHNIVGFMNGSRKVRGNEYVIVGAHFDNIGTFGGRLYPGADANASGTVAAVSLAEMFNTAKIIGKTYFKSVIFVAFDAKENGKAGSEAFWNALEQGRLKDPMNGRTIEPGMIRLMVNIDQIGSSLSPLASGRPDYLLAVDSGTLGERERDLLDWCNGIFETGLELCHSYYGSANFTSVFFRITDQEIFARHGIPSVLFTSGITMNNNKPRDTAATLDYEVFKRRIWLIWHWIEYQLY